MQEFNFFGKKLPVIWLLYFFISILFCIYAYKFIRITSFVIDGERYFSLFDDAMISMRYAWNFIHGKGLVWNAGEFIEGYTNFLWVLVMSVPMLVLDRINSVLAIQILGVALTLFTGYLTIKITRFFELKNHFLKILLLASVFTYYPLVYWFLFGMETSLVTLLLLLCVYVSLDYVAILKIQKLYVLGVLMSILYLTRPDTLYFSAILILYLFVSENKDFISRPNLQTINFNFIKPFLILFISFLFHTAFRYFYYGTLIPNTVLLKVIGFPTDVRLETGFAFTLGYIIESLIILILSALSLIFNSFKKEKILFLVLIWATIFYQIWVGGDAWNYWRFFVPIFPLIVLLISSFIEDLINIIPNEADFAQIKRGIIGFFIFAFAFFTYNGRFMNELTLKVPPYQVKYNAYNVLYALKLKDFLNSSGRVAVFWAGSIPYYTDYYFIDMLGKMDRTIASKAIYIDYKAPFGKKTTPGHNKFDIYYSIITLNPDVAQNIAWVNQNAGTFDNFQMKPERYLGLEYWVNKNSTNINSSILQ